MDYETLNREGLDALQRWDYDGAAERFRRAGELATSESDRALAAIRLASTDVLRGRRDADMQVFRENILRRHSPLHVMLGAYYLTISAVDQGQRDTATRYLPVLLEAAHELNQPYHTIIAYDAAAGAESIRGNHVAAIEYGRVALAAAASLESGDPSLRAAIAHNLAYNCLAASEYGDAVTYVEEALRHLDVVTDAAWGAQFRVTAAFAYLCRERLDDATVAIDAAEPRASGTEHEKYVHYIRGEIARRRGDRDEAARQFRKLEPFYPGIPTLTEMLLSMNVAPFLLPE